jgi:NAD(P)-dependent dehydrogenase (short-subunit alcohol dehydrogenase family)
MARVLITGSSDGLGLMAAELLAHEGHASLCTLATFSGPVTPVELRDGDVIAEVHRSSGRRDHLRVS